MATLTLDDLVVTHGTTRVVDDVSARFEPGTITAVLGPNGAGKSTLLNTIVGLHQPAAGRIQLGGVALGEMPMTTRARHFGLLPQHGTVHWNVSVESIVQLGRLPHQQRRGRNCAADEAAVERALAVTRLENLRDKPILSLSGGERARALLARVLAGEPDWLLADEPLANLDPAYQLDVIAILRDFARRGGGVLVVLHDLTHALRAADQALLLHQGRAIACGAPETVLSQDNLSRVFGITAQHGLAADGQPFVLPTARG
ncbi:MAG: ABC transporter ATP-binding protein [Gammaproteobacteria bacterium]|nr:ABC transporter ATP-binding protein [Gammaproteobacteria bacterium]